MSSLDTVERAGDEKRAQMSVNIALMVVGVATVIGGIRYGFGSLSSPGSGFVPSLVGAALVGFSAFLLMQSLRNGREGGDEGVGNSAISHDVALEPAVAITKSASTRLSTPLAVLACMVCFAFVLLATEFLGLLITSSIVVGVLAYLMRTRWWTSILLGIGFYATSYLIFAMWLAIPLPFGSITTG